MTFIISNLYSSGSKVHDIRLQAEQGNLLTVQDLVKKIHEVTEIPPANQKILYKGISKTKNDTFTKYVYFVYFQCRKFCENIIL